MEKFQSFIDGKAVNFITFPRPPFTLGFVSQYLHLLCGRATWRPKEEDSGKLRNYVHADPFSTLGSGYIRVQQGKHPSRLSSRHVAALLSTPILCDGLMIAYLPA